VKLRELSRQRQQFCGLSIALVLDDIENEFQSGEQIRQSKEPKMTLDKIPLDTLARVTSVEATDSHGLRLMEMGVVPGAPVRVVKAAPLGDPIQVCVRDYHLALRRSEAKSIQVVLDDNCDIV
jgi:ferrous iron transport protein A